MFHAGVHIHSRVSRARAARSSTSSTVSSSALHKGLRLLGTSDFARPAWAAELGEPS